MNALKLVKPLDLTEEIAKYISALTGRDYSEKLRVRVEVKMKRRIAELHLNTLAEYETYFERHSKDELKLFVILLTTQATQFFGEYSHFEYLSDHYLKSIIPVLRKRPDKTLTVWSAACSRGQEAFSLAMFLKNALKVYGEDLQVNVTGTDAYRDGIQYAQAGAYPREEFRDVPLQYWGNDWERVAVGGVDMLRAKPSLKALVHFEHANLLSLKNKFAGRQFDLIFARNVFSFFNESQIQECARELFTHLEPHGRFFIGVSESLAHLGLPVESQGPSIYALRT